MKKISVSKGGEREKKYSQTTRLIFLHTHTLLRGDQISVRIDFFQNRKRNCCGEKTPAAPGNVIPKKTSVEDDGVKHLGSGDERETGER